jgi:SRSO17 transposase
MMLAQQVGRDLREPDGVIVFDPSCFPKKGNKSAGVARQWCGRLGKVEDCQVGVFTAYVTRKEHALVNMRLHPTEGWAKDRARRKEAGVPRAIKLQETRSAGASPLPRAPQPDIMSHMRFRSICGGCGSR